MAQLSSSPRQHTTMLMEKAKSFSLGLRFLDQDDVAVDITGATVLLKIVNKSRYGSTVALTKEADFTGDPVDGFMRIDLQADDLDLAVRIYDFVIVMHASTGYSGVIVKGELEIVPNGEVESLALTYSTITPSQTLTVLLGENNEITVKVESYAHPGISIITDHLEDATDAHNASAISILDAAAVFTATDVEGALAELAVVGSPALELHLNDTGDAHDASSISIADAGGLLTATDVEGALAELAAGGGASGTALAAHLADTADAHDASSISILDAANDFTATDVEGALAELQAADEVDEAALAAHLTDTTDAHDASAISVLDAGGNFTGTDVETVLAELASGGGSGNPFQSTTGFGLPTTVGREEGDIHYERVGGREYVLVDIGGTLTWKLIGGATSTVGSGVPTPAGRVEGDRHYDLTGTQDYILTGVAGTSVYDDFNRANGNSTHTSSGAAYLSGTANVTSSRVSNIATSGRVELGHANQVGSLTLTLHATGISTNGTSGVLAFRTPAGAGDSYDVALGSSISHGHLTINILRNGISLIGGAQDTGIAAVAGNTHLLSASIVGQNFVVNVDNDYTYTFTDPGSALTGTRSGWAASLNGGYIDDWSAFAVGSLAWTAL